MKIIKATILKGMTRVIRRLMRAFRLTNFSSKTIRKLKALTMNWILLTMTDKGTINAVLDSGVFGVERLHERDVDVDEHHLLYQHHVRDKELE